MSDRIIVVRERRRGFGCLSSLVIVAAAGWLFYTLIADVIADAPERQRAARDAAERAAERAADPAIPRPFPDSIPGTIEMQFRRTLRDRLLDPDSYRPHGAPRAMPHPLGRLYIQDYTALNALGGPAREMSGLLFATNKAHAAWTYLAPDQLAAELQALVGGPQSP